MDIILTIECLFVQADSSYRITDSYLPTILQNYLCHMFAGTFMIFVQNRKSLRISKREQVA